MPAQPVRCPRCGSQHLAACTSNDYSLGLGCLGFLLFNWLGLLIGFLGGNGTTFICLNCGHRFSPSVLSCGGCGCLVLILLAILLLLGT